jgi:hypothetical protein
VPPSAAIFTAQRFVLDASVRQTIPVIPPDRSSTDAHYLPPMVFVEGHAACYGSLVKVPTITYAVLWLLPYAITLVFGAVPKVFSTAYYPCSHINTND